MQCEESKPLLFEFASGQLDHATKGNLDDHLKDCSSCSELLEQIWEMEMQSANWQDESPGKWDRRAYFFGHEPRFQFLQTATVFASLIIVTLVLFRMEVTSDTAGLKISFLGDRVTTEELDERIKQLQRELDARNRDYLNIGIDRFARQQTATNQLLLRTAIEASRQERRQELGSLMTLWDMQQDRQSRLTDDSLRLLLRSQVEDKRELRYLTEAFQTISAQQDGNL